MASEREAITLNPDISRISQGMKVLSFDGDEIGKVRDVHPQFIEVETSGGLLNLFSSEHYYIPTDHIDHLERDALVVDTKKNDFDRLGWHQRPTVTLDEEVTRPAADFEGRQTESSMDFGTAATEQPRTGRTSRTGRADRSDLSDREEKIELKEESLRARKRDEQVGEVRISKHVEEQEQAIDVPVSHEEVTIERRAVDREATGGIGSDESVRIPLHAEEAELEKRTRVYEEIDVDKEAVTDTEKMRGTVRREVADMDTTGDVDVRRSRSDQIQRDREDYDQPGAI